MLLAVEEAGRALRGNPTLLVLLLMSIGTLGLSLERLWWLVSHRRRLQHGLRNVLAHLHEGHADSAAALNQSLPPHAASELFDWILRHESLPHPSPTLARHLARLGRRAKRRLWLIGSSASVAPFVGLFGTVIGIMRAFEAIAQEPGGGVSVVGGGISEALVTTAAGIFVAIEAVLFFNALQVLSASTLADVREATEALLEAKGGGPSPESAAHGRLSR